MTRQKTDTRTSVDDASSSPVARSSEKTGQAGPVGVGLNALTALLRAPGRPVGARVGAALGSLAAASLRDRRRVALTQIAFALPELSLHQREVLWRESLRHQGRSLVELAHLAGSSAQRAAVLDQVVITGQEHIDHARELAGPGRGLVVVTAHLGNWEVCLAAMAARGHPMSVVHHDLGRPGLSRWLGQVRTRDGDVELVELGRARAGQLLAAVRGGRHLVAMMDQNARVDEGAFVPFFGAPACTRRGPALLALRLGVPLLPAFAQRVGHGPGHRIEFQPPIELGPAGSGPEEIDRAVDDALTRVNRMMEGFIRATPEQWIWSHRRYKTRPEGAAAHGFDRAPPDLPARRKRLARYRGKR